MLSLYQRATAIAMAKPADAPAVPDDAAVNLPLASTLNLC